MEHYRSRSYHRHPSLTFGEKKSTQKKKLFPSSPLPQMATTEAAAAASSSSSLADRADARSISSHRSSSSSSSSSSSLRSRPPPPQAEEEDDEKEEKKEKKKKKQQKPFTKKSSIVLDPPHSWAKKDLIISYYVDGGFCIAEDQRFLPLPRRPLVVDSPTIQQCIQKYLACIARQTPPQIPFAKWWLPDVPRTKRFDRDRIFALAAHLAPHWYSSISSLCPSSPLVLAQATQIVHTKKDPLSSSSSLPPPPPPPPAP